MGYKFLAVVQELKRNHTLSSEDALTVARCYRWAEELLDRLNNRPMGLSSKRLLVIAEGVTELSSELLITEVFGNGLPVRFFRPLYWPLRQEARYEVNFQAFLEHLGRSRIPLADISGKCLLNIWQEAALECEVSVFQGLDGGRLTFPEIVQSMRDSGVSLRSLSREVEPGSERERRTIERRREDAAQKFIGKWEAQRLEIERETIFNFHELYLRAQRELSLDRVGREFLARLLVNHWQPGLTATEVGQILDELIDKVANLASDPLWRRLCEEWHDEDVSASNAEESIDKYILELLTNERRWAESFLRA